MLRSYYLKELIYRCSKKLFKTFHTEFSDINFNNKFFDEFGFN